MPNSNDDANEKITRIVDMKLPLSWLISGAVTITLAFGAMYAKLGQISEEVTDLKITTRAGNVAQNTITGQIAIMTFRMENAETELKRLREQVK